MATLTVQPLLPPSVWLSLLGAAVIMLGIYAARRPHTLGRMRWAVLVSLMGLSIAMVLLLLLNLQWVTPAASPDGKPTLTVLVDASGSMATTDGADHLSRLNTASKAVQDVTSKLAERFDVELVAFSDSPRPIQQTAQLQPTGISTDVAAALLPSLQRQHPAGQAIWLLSDGIPTAPGAMGELEKAVRTARTQDTPVYTTTLGTSQKAIDLAVDLRYPQDMAFVDQPVSVIAQLHHAGLPGRQVQVWLRQGETELGYQTVTLPEHGAATVRFPVRQSTPGVWPYRVQAEALPDETVLSNNTALYVLKVVDRPVRVLVLEGKPYWDSKFFLQTLSAVPAVRVDSYVRVKDGRFIVRSGGSAHSPTTAPAPATQPEKDEGRWRVVTDAHGVLGDPAQLGQYRVIVLGREAEAFLTPEAVENIQRWVSRDGGALLCYRGAPASVIDERLGKLLPVSWSPTPETHFSPRLTEAGQQLQWLSWGDSADQAPAELPLLAMRQKQDNAKPLAVVVASANSAGERSSAFVYQPYGAGRVVVIEGSGMWRWAFALPQQRASEAIYQTLWQGTMRWLVSGGGLQPGEQRLLRADATIFRPVESATATMLVRPELVSSAQPQVKLLKGDGSAVGQFAPKAFGDDVGVYHVDFGKLAEGPYRALITGDAEAGASAQIAFEVRDPGDEKLDLSARPELMARIARDTGGDVLTASDAAGLADRFLAHQMASRPPRLERSSVWDRWWVLASALGLWAVCWGLRRYWGLV